MICFETPNIVQRKTKNLHKKQFLAMINLIISILLSLGLIFSAADYNNATPQEKKELHKKTGIVGDDAIIGF